MKNILFYILFLELICLSNTFFPIWDFDNNVIELNRYYQKYVLCDKWSNEVYIQIQRILSSNENKLNISHNLILQKISLYGVEASVYKEKIEFDYVETAIYHKGYFFVCPKGKFHVYIFRDGAEIGLLDGENKIEGDWELKCFWIKEKYILIVSYSKDNILYQYNLDKTDKRYLDQNEIYNGIYDIKFNSNQIFDANGNIHSIAFINKNKELILNELQFFLDFTYFDWQIDDSYERKINDINYNNNKAYFSRDNDSYNFYWISYDDSNAFNFDSGFYNDNEEITVDNLKNINIFTNKDKSPFEFYDKFIIKEMNVIPDTKYFYYEIYNEEKNVTYHGIIDIVLNKIIFNTDKELTKFIPYSNNSMLAFYNEIPYKICVISNGTDCIDECPNEIKHIHNINLNNICTNKCSGKQFLFMPYELCIDNCDLNIYTKKNGESFTQCGLCKNLYEDKPYKMINYSECLSNPPENSRYINEELKILTCNNGEYKDGKCGDSTTNCYTNCKTCSEYSINPEDQKCLTCEDNYVLQDSNCINNCKDGFYEKNKRCEKCDETCQICKTSPSNCSKCKDGYYLENGNQCKKCSDFCETCSKGEENNIHNCLTCDKTKPYIYLFNSSCYKDCPENTTKSKDAYICIMNNNNNNNDNDNKSENSLQKESTLLLVFMGVFSFIILMIMICFFKKNCCQKSNYYDNLVKDIYKELK